MKAKRNLFIGIILGGLIGWAFGFLRFPYVEKNFSFLLGFASCLAFALLVLFLLFLWNKNSLLLRLIGKAQTTKDSKTATGTYAFISILIAAFIFFGGMLSSFLIYKQNELFKTQTQNKDIMIQEQSELIESVRQSNMVILMNNVLDKVDDELKDNPNRTLSDRTIANIVAAFNYSFKPYRYWEGDSLSEKMLSPEKGQLLIALSIKNIDSSSFDKIKLTAHFYGADLRGADLQGIDLSGADLKGADLKESDLSSANLAGADLRGANLWGANFNMTNLSGADLRRADLSWAELNESDLKSANLNGADLTNAQLRKTDLRGATFRTAKLDGVLLNEANLEGGDLVAASLVRANLTMVNLTKVDVVKANFKEAIMTEMELSDINVEKDWFEKLNEWQITGAKEIQEGYTIVENEVLPDVFKYHLKKN